MRHQAKGVRYLTRKLMNHGIKNRAAVAAITIVTQAIRETLLEGHDVTLKNIGVFYFGYRVGRHRPAITTGQLRYQKPATYQPASYPLKFKQVPVFKNDFRLLIGKVKPFHPRIKKTHGGGFKPNKKQTL